MAERQRRCTWCLQPFVRGHPCDPALVAPAESTPKPRQAKAREPRTPRHAKAPRDGRGNLGSVARNIVVTPLGYSMVSPAVRARIAERERTVS